MKVLKNLKTITIFIVLWHLDPLLDNDREISKYTTAVTE
jgi:hypothetical protein